MLNDLNDAHPDTQELIRSISEGDYIYDMQGRNDPAEKAYLTKHHILDACVFLDEIQFDDQLVIKEIPLARDLLKLAYKYATIVHHEAVKQKRQGNE